MLKILTKISNFFKPHKKLKISNGVNKIKKPTGPAPLNHRPSGVRSNLTGFTLPETMVSVAIFIMVILLTGSIYSLSQTSYKKSSDLAELTQNNRVFLDRLSRELRQAVDIITTLPPTNNDPLNPPAEQIIFQDGHDLSQITYLRYYLNGADLMREHSAYYFDTDTATYVAYGSLDQGGQPATKEILEDRIIGEYFEQLKFWGASGLINIQLKLTKNTNVFEIKTSVFTRN